MYQGIAISIPKRSTRWIESISPSECESERIISNIISLASESVRADLWKLYYSSYTRSEVINKMKQKYPELVKEAME